MERAWYDRLRALAREVLAALWSVRLSLAGVIVAAVLFAFFPDVVTDLFLAPIALERFFIFLVAALIIWTIPLWHFADLALANWRHRQGRSEFPRFLVHVFDRGVPLLLGLAPLFLLLGFLLHAINTTTRCVTPDTQADLEFCQGFAYDDDIASLGTSLQKLGRPVPELAEAVSQLRIEAWSVTAVIIFFTAMVVVVAIVRTRASRGAWVPQTPTRRLFLTVLLGLLAALTIIVSEAMPLQFSSMFGRLVLLPAIFGAWIGIIGALATLLGRARWIVVAMAVAAFLVSPFRPHYFDLPVYESSFWKAAQQGATTPATPRQRYIVEAIASWRAANNCTDDASRCPPPILVAAEGGGSRSAFFTATVLGALIDKTRADKQYVDISKALFVLSGVSGGSLGVATTRLALQDGRNTPPCRYVSPEWFGDNPRYAGEETRDPMKSWRACLQLLTVGDYLSAPAIGVLRDTFAWLSPANRATLLEQSMEAYYNLITTGAPATCSGADDQRGLCRPVGYLLNDVGWTPLLMLHATAIDTGRRVFFSDLATGTASNDVPTCIPVSVTGHNVFELSATNPFARPDGKLVVAPPACVFPNLERAPDVRIGTAVAASAGFPILLPESDVRYTADGQSVITARLVDGGYYENSGLETIDEIIPLLRAQGLRPLVIYLANAPWFAQEHQLAGRSWYRQKQDALQMSAYTTPAPSYLESVLTLVAVPLEGLTGSRGAHGESLISRIMDEANTPVPGADPSLPSRFRFVIVRVKRSVDVPANNAGPAASLCVDPPPATWGYRAALYQPVLSLWLSVVAQRTLDAQLCDRDNEQAITQILAALQQKAGY